MAHSCVSTSTSALRFNSLVFSNPSRSETNNNSNLSLPFGPLRSRDLRTSVSRIQPPKALNSSGLWTPEQSSRKGIWSIRDDIPVPSSPYAREQAPPPMVMERYQSAIGQLFQYRIIHCGGPVEDEMANTIVAQLLYLDAIDPKTDIVMYINSPGGSVTAGMAIFDIMRHIRPDVSTICGGLAASMGAFLLSAGTKGKRFSLPRSRIMIHQPYSGLQGDVVDMEIQVSETMHHKANLAGFLSYHTGQPLETINRDTERDFFMSAAEAKDYGIIDGVMTDRSKGLLSLVAASAGQ